MPCGDSGFGQCGGGIFFLTSILGMGRISPERAALRNFGYAVQMPMSRIGTEKNDKCRDS